MKKLIVGMILGLFSMTASAFYSGNSFNPGGDDYFVAVMNHLKKVTEFTDWGTYAAQLEALNDAAGVGGTAKVDSVTVDVWWLLTEPSNNNFDFSYYDRLFGEIKRKGLSIIPILSLHQCGTGAGDVCNYPLPSWVSNSSTDSERSFNRNGYGVNREYLAYWWDGRASFNGYPAQSSTSTGTYSTSNIYGVHPNYGNLGGAYKEYREYIQAFVDHYSSNNQCYDEEGVTYTCKDLADSFRKTYISHGPSGELRYPSFSTPYPGFSSRGTMPVETTEAKRSFEKWVYENISTDINTVNNRYGTNWAWGNGSFNNTHGEVWMLQNDGKDGHPTANLAVDTFNWYQDLLEDHIGKLKFIADEVGLYDLGRNGLGTRGGVKFAGVHWRYYSENGMTEQAAKMSGYYDYGELLDAVRANDMDATFTALELANCPPPCGDNSGAYALVQKFWLLAQERGVPLFGENALAMGNNQAAYDRMHSHLWENNYRRYAGITYLRINNLVSLSNPSNKLDDWWKFQWLLRDQQAPAVDVHFQCDNGFTGWGDNVYAVGSFNNWDTNTAIKLDASNYPTWKKHLYRAPADTTIEWKCIKKNSSGQVYQWEPGDNNTVTTPSEGRVDTYGSF